MKFMIYFCMIFLVMGCSQRSSIEMGKASKKQSVRDIEIAKLSHKIHKKHKNKSKKKNKKSIESKKKEIKITKNIKISKTKIVKKDNLNTLPKQISQSNKKTKKIDKKIIKNKAKEIEASLPIKESLIDEQFITNIIKSQFTPVNIVVTVVQALVRQDPLVSLFVSICVHIRDFFPKKDIQKAVVTVEAS